MKRDANTEQGSQRCLRKSDSAPRFTVTLAAVLTVTPTSPVCGRRAFPSGDSPLRRSPRAAVAALVLSCSAAVCAVPASPRPPVQPRSRRVRAGRNLRSPGLTRRFYGSGRALAKDGGRHLGRGDSSCWAAALRDSHQDTTCHTCATTGGTPEIKLM